MTGADESAEVTTIDPLSDELALARSQIDSGLSGLAEATARRRLARLEAEGAAAATDEVEALQLLLAEALWRQQRHVPARAELEAIRPGSARRHLPIAMLVEAETLAAAGETDRATGVQERLLAAIGPDAAFALRRSVPGRLGWPLPAEMRAEPPRPQRPPWGPSTATGPTHVESPPDDERVAQARSRVEEARVAYVAGDLERGDGRLSLALRLDAGVAADGVRILEPTLGRQPATERLLLYGDLLRAAGREAEATAAYDRAATGRS